MSNYKECQELKNIKYKSIAPIDNNDNTDINGLEKMLDQESKLSKTLPWNKLDKTEKISKLTHYIDTSLNSAYILNHKESHDIKKYLINCLDISKLQRVKEVDYNKEKGVINGIPALTFNQSSRTFTLKKSDKRVSTLKSLSNPSLTKKNRERTKKHKSVDKIDTKK